MEKFMVRKPKFSQHLQMLILRRQGGCWTHSSEKTSMEQNWTTMNRKHLLSCNVIPERRTCISNNRTQFWAKTYKEEHYKSLASKAIKELVSFHSSYLSEQGFSQMINIKNKNRNKLVGGALSACLRVALTKTVEPRFNMIQRKIQEQRSH